MKSSRLSVGVALALLAGCKDYPQSICDCKGSDFGQFLDSEIPQVRADSATRPDSGPPPDSGDPPQPGPDATAAPPGACLLPRFPDGTSWNTPVDGAPLDPASPAIIGHLEDTGFGHGVFQIDFSLDLICADADEPLVPFTPTDDFYSPDCDALPVPLPVGGNIEGEEAYACTSDGDCHLLVSQPASRTLFEMWRANVSPAGFQGGCLAVWDVARVPPPDGRGEGCTSADAAGLPIAPLLFDADEVATGTIRHAIRFILPNDRIRSATYVRPGTHATRAATGGDDSPPYGARLRLKDDFDLNRLPSDAARVVGRALMDYGMVLADGGNIALTARSDRHTTAKWADLDFDSHSLFAITPEDFEVVSMGQTFLWNGDCERR